MSYEDMGGIDLGNLLKCGATVAGVAGGAVADPYLPEVACRLSPLQALTTGRTPAQILTGKKTTVPVPACKATPLGQKGIGVEQAIRPLRAAVYVGRNPSVVWLGAAAIVGVPLLLGYMLGKRSR